MTTMKEALVHPDLSVTIQDGKVPVPQRGQILVKVYAAATNPKDWKIPLWTGHAHNSGDDIAGIVEAVGDDVFEFRPGDRVAGFHVAPQPFGAYAEYAITPAYATFHVPSNISFEEASTIPLTALTAAFALFYDLELRPLFLPIGKPGSEDLSRLYPTTNVPLLIYGASAAIGAFGVKLAAAAGIHPIVAVGTRVSSQYLVDQGFLDASKGDRLLDYTDYAKPEDLVAALRAAVVDGGYTSGRAMHAYDAISAPGTSEVLASAIAGARQPVTGMRPKMAVTMPGADYSCVDPSVDVLITNVGLAHAGGETERAFSFTWSRLFGRGLMLGWMRGHPYDVVEGGLDGLEEGLKRLRDGKVRGKKLVVRIGETKGIKRT